MIEIQRDARNEYESWHDRLAVDAAADTPWHSLVKQHLNIDRDLTGKKVLEIACGRGGFACWLASEDHRPREIVASDFALIAVAKGRAFAQEAGISTIKWEVGDIQSLAHPDASFDTVISCETIEHVPDPRKAIRELSRVLKPGGRLFLTTPNYFGTMGLFRGYLRLSGRPYTEEGQPINNFLVLPRTRAWVASEGLRIATVDAVGHYLPFPGRPPIEMPRLNDPRIAMRWVGLHSLIIAEKFS